MKDLDMAWLANHYIQYLLDAYSYAMYICDYITKALKSTNTLMAEAHKETKNGNIILKQSGKQIPKCCRITNNGSMVWYITIANKSIKKEFVMTCRCDEWVFIAKDRETKQQLQPNSEDVKLSGNIDKYTTRSKTQEDRCLADSVEKIDIKYVKHKTRGTQKDMVTASERNNVEENDMQGDVDICEYDSNILHTQKKKHWATWDWQCNIESEIKNVIWFVSC